MEDSQNKLVVKVKYQGLNKEPGQSTEPQMVTEWHTGRIVGAIIIFLLFIMLPFYLFEEDDDASKSVNTIPTVDNEILEKQLPKKIIKSVDVIPIPSDSAIKANNKNNISSKPLVNIKENNIETELKKVPERLPNKNIVRAVLAKGIYDKEPVGGLVLPLVLNKVEASRVYYFTEIINMKGQYLYHQWLRNDQEVYKRKISILGNRWRASTNKLIVYSKVGNWTVRLVNKQGVILNEIQFEAIE